MSDSQNGSPRAIKITRVSAAIALLLTFAGPLIWLTLSSRTTGDITRVEEILSAPGGDGDRTSSTTMQAAGARPSLILPNEATLLEDVAAVGGRIPVVLEIASINVKAPIVPYGVDGETGQMDIPNNVRDVAWYRFGPSPGESGSAVLAAHLDLAGQGPGVFFSLHELEPGERVSIGFDDSSTQMFRVVGRVIYHKDELPLGTIFSREGAPVVTLITCGGGFNDSERSYDSNVVVYAESLGP